MEATLALMDVMGCQESRVWMECMAAMDWMGCQGWMESQAPPALREYLAPTATTGTRG